MTDDELFDEIEELLHTKVAYHYEQGLANIGEIGRKHQEQSGIYYNCLQLIRKVREDKRNFMTLYGIFECISDYEFCVEDVLSKDKNGNFLIFPTEAKALAHLPKDWLDKANHGTEYKIKPIEVREEGGLAFECPDCGYNFQWEEIEAYKRKIL